MSRYCGPNTDAEPILNAAEHWRQKSLLQDKGVFADEEIWRIDYFEELDQHFIKQLDKKEDNKDKIFEKLETLLEPRPPETKQLAAEIWWLMLLCENNYLKKRKDVKTIWEKSGKQFPENSELLADKVLAGIANVGAGFFARLAWEWDFVIQLIIELKRLPLNQRKELLSDGWKFAEWVEQIPECATRQSRHMILFLLFPDNFERIFSANHRKKIVSKFTGNTAQKLSAVEIDRALLDIRNKKEEEYGTVELDFFNPPLKEQWQNGNSQIIKPKLLAGSPTNLILYGPPGTGKTYWLDKKKKQYSSERQIQTTLPSSKQDETREDWLRQEIWAFDPQWLDIIIGVLYDLGKAKLTEISKHEYVRIRTPMTNNKNVRRSISTYLREHANKDSKIVPETKYDRPPFVFDQYEDKIWYLVDDWEEKCREEKREKSVEFAKKLKAGPGKELSGERTEDEPVHELHDQRFEFVTFHQAYSYEDFVEGIRPQEETGQIGYKVVPGVFKRICNRAKEDPGRQYAIFIDEINRGNIASIFGELITLLETDKRVTYGQNGMPKSGGMTLTLPYSREQFGVPANLDVYGTMNTADRSIALLDTALRRRFQFKELMPDASTIKGSSDDGLIKDGQDGTINLRALLEAINRRISFLLSRDMTIGHSYFIGVRNFSELKNALFSRIIPLLQEYFYNDWHRIQLVFRDVGLDGKKIEPQIIRHEPMNKEEILGSDHDGFEDSIDYSVTPEDKITPDAIRKVYESRND